MRRGSLFDPFSQSVSSSKSKVSETAFTPSSASEVYTPAIHGLSQAGEQAAVAQSRGVPSCLRDGRDGSATASRSLGKGHEPRLPAARGVRFSPELPTHCGRHSRATSSGKQRTMETQTRISIAPVEEGNQKRNWSPAQEPQSSQDPKLIEWSNAVPATRSGHCLAPSVGIAAPYAAPTASNNGGVTRENDSLSISSISFGKDDVRMRGSDTRELVDQNVAQALPVVTGMKKLKGEHLPDKRAEAEQKESVARQLDFDEGGTPLIAQLQGRKSASPVARIKTVQRKERTMLGTPLARVPSGSPPYACTSGSEWDTVDWDSSLSREIAPAGISLRSANANTAASPATTLREFSPLRSDCGASITPREVYASQAMVAHPDVECPYCGNRPQPSMDDRAVPVAIERVSSSADDGSILLQLRLGTHSVESKSLQRGKSHDCMKLASRSEPSYHRKSWPTYEKNLACPSHGSSISLLEPPHLSTSVDSAPTISEGLSLFEHEPFGGMRRASSAPCLQSGDVQRSVASLGVSGRAHSQKKRAKGSERFFRSKSAAHIDASLEDLRYTVQALRERYLQHHSQAKPFRQFTNLCHTRQRTVSHSQLQRRCRHLAGSCGSLKLRGGRAQMGSRRCR